MSPQLSSVAQVDYGRNHTSLSFLVHWGWIPWLENVFLQALKCCCLSLSQRPWNIKIKYIIVCVYVLHLLSLRIKQYLAKLSVWSLLSRSHLSFCQRSNVHDKRGEKSRGEEKMGGLELAEERRRWAREDTMRSGERKGEGEWREEKNVGERRFKPRQERIKGRERMDEIRDKKPLPYYSILLFKWQFTNQYIHTPCNPYQKKDTRVNAGKTRPEHLNWPCWCFKGQWWYLKQKPHMDIMKTWW